MSLSILLTLIAGVAAFLAVLNLPAPRLAGRMSPSIGACQPLLSALLGLTVRTFGRDCPQPPAQVLRAFKRGEALVITHGGRP